MDPKFGSGTQAARTNICNNPPIASLKLVRVLVPSGKENILCIHLSLMSCDFEQANNSTDIMSTAVLSLKYFMLYSMA
jgi:hypothetical protein